MNEHIGITGPNGRLGRELVKRGCTPLYCDITKPDEIKEEVDRAEPTVIVNCAAYTSVDSAEDEEEYKKAFTVNYSGLKALLDIFRGEHVIHISTDYVFSGRKGPYSEDSKYDKFGPVNNYGWSKLGGEYLSEIYPACVIVRTTGLYDGNPETHDFLNLLVNKLRNGEGIDVTTRLHGNQTYIPHLADGILRLTGFLTPPRIIHIASEDIYSRYEFAMMIASMFGLDKSLIVPTSKPSGWIAKRPTKGGLKVKLAQKLGIPIHSVLEGLEEAKRGYGL
jgi:dTDP-4-dehydrorhamnose reductase